MRIGKYCLQIMLVKFLVINISTFHINLCTYIRTCTKRQILTLQHFICDDDILVHFEEFVVDVDFIHVAG